MKRANAARPKKRTRATPSSLRERAEAAVRTTHEDIARMPTEEIQRLVHELQVHHIELEMQNEELRRTQAELAHSRDRFSELYDFAPAGYITMDAAGAILEANLTAALMLGVGRADLIGENLTHFIAPESQDTFYLHRRELFARGKPLVCELNVRCGQGTSLAVHLESNRFTDPASKAVRCRTILLDIAERQRAREALAATQSALQEANEHLRQSNRELERRVSERTAQLRALTAELTHAEERERQRVADALHEGLLQMLTAAVIHLANLKWHVGDGAAKESIEKVQSCINEAIIAGRTLTHELSPPVLHSLGLSAALEWLGQWHGEKYGLAVKVDAVRGIGIEEKELRITLFRAAHELLFNVFKHARVLKARVRLRRMSSGAVRLVVSDSGAGFDPEAVRAREGSHGGFGLFSLRERIETLGGTFDVRSAPGRGSRFTITVPAAKDRHP